MRSAAFRSIVLGGDGDNKITPSRIGRLKMTSIEKHNSAGEARVGDVDVDYDVLLRAGDTSPVLEEIETVAAIYDYSSKMVMRCVELGRLPNLHCLNRDFTLGNIANEQLSNLGKQHTALFCRVVMQLKKRSYAPIC